MTTDITLYRSLTNQPQFYSFSAPLFENPKLPIALKSDLPEILFISSFPPRECGIATYSQDLLHALNHQFDTSFVSAVCALESETEQHQYAQAPKYLLNTDERNAFVKMAFKINQDASIKLVVFQHEFGFYAKNEAQFKLFYTAIIQPIVFVFHTVLPNPNPVLKTKVQNMVHRAASVVVMTKHAATILKNDYEVDKIKIVIIPHGTHLVPPLNRKQLKKQYQLSNRKVLSTFGLLGSSKSIETTLKALPEVVQAYPEVLFLVLGKTHPTVVKNEGEAYRTLLEAMVKELHLEANVRFVNAYLPLPTLLEYLQLTDIYLFTSKDRNQAVSGTFSYAVSCGCPVISTPIPHAKEVLGNNNGIIVDFEDAAQLSKAIISLLDDAPLRKQISSNSFHEMASTAWENSALTHALLFQSLMGTPTALKYQVPPFNLDHVKRMTTDFGMIQFSKIANPDLQSGYTLDDNARALIAIGQHYEMFQEADDLRLILIYLQFITFCMQANGLFLNYVNTAKEFTQQNDPENLEDSNGRAIWALGYVISLKKILPIYLCIEAEKVLEQAVPNLKNIHSTRAMAFIIKGLHYQNKSENQALLNTLANRLVNMYEHERTEDWLWYESYLTYGNSVLPEAMLCAYLSTNNEVYKTIAQESFDFLLSKIFVDDAIKVISNKGWHLKDVANEAVVGGEQPIDVAYTLMGLEQFYAVFKTNEYLQKATTAFHWFLGNNHLHQIVYNPCTGGCYDGVEAHNVNLNQGAESTLSYLMGRLTIERLMNKPLLKDKEQGNKVTQKKSPKSELV